MKLFKLIKNIKCRILGNINLDIFGLYHRDTDVEKGGLFFCINGTKTNGEEFVQNAAKNGAVAVVTEKELKGVCLTQIIVSDTRRAMSMHQWLVQDILKDLQVFVQVLKLRVSLFIKNLFLQMRKHCLFLLAKVEKQPILSWL